MTTQEIIETKEKLVDFVGEFGPLLGHKKRKHWCGVYLSGLMLDGERKSIEPMSQRVPGGNEQNLQQFVNQSGWEHEPIQDHLIDVMVNKLKPKEGVLILDDTSLPKKGDDSVGVARQYCGALGKVSNCQSVVSWHFANRKYHFPLISELYLPTCWTDDLQRMKEVGVPEDRFEFQEKWRIALDLLPKIKEKVPYEVILVDAGYGECRDFLRELNRTEEKFVAQIPGSHGFYPAGVPILAPQTGVGRKRHSNQVVDSDMETYLTGKKWLEVLLGKKKAWKNVTLPLQDKKVVRATAVRVYAADMSTKLHRLDYEGWLIIEKVGDEFKYYIANFPKNRSWKSLLRVAHLRWKIEQGYQQLKEELGLDHFEGRSWRGLHHHIVLCCMAYCFLILIQQDEKKRNQNERHITSDQKVA
jgi:SRSO17 transposase